MDVAEFLASDAPAAQALRAVGVSFAAGRFECADPPRVNRLRSALAPVGEAAAFVEELSPILSDRGALNAALLPFVAPGASGGGLGLPAVCFQVYIHLNTVDFFELWESLRVSFLYFSWGALRARRPDTLCLIFVRATGAS
jgi:hypothetical protein